MVLTLWDNRLNLISRPGDRFTLKSMEQTCFVGHEAWPEDLWCDKRLSLRGQHATGAGPLDLTYESMKLQAPTVFLALFNSFRTKIVPLNSVYANIYPADSAMLTRTSYVGHQDGEILSPVSKSVRSLRAARNAN